eukprot:GEMP01061772.1.p1 GENE.GEMP01061772.1~~GEMP01061772.1.p1  ORF type:complete len:217 (+),score=40.91 GEMP01061772.1:43-693(+)
MTGAVISEEMKGLMEQKEALEKKIEDLTAFLTGPGMPGVRGGLLDEEGFPRADLDLYSIRSSRQSLAIAQTDHTELMKIIEKNLWSIHEKSRIAVPRALKDPISPVPERRESVGQVQQPMVETTNAFALIDEVNSDSPAIAAGFAVGDTVVSFGGICREGRTTQECFQEIQQLVPRSVDTPVPVIIRRGLLEMTISVTPKPWAGRGLLGCHLAPLN